MYYIYIKLRGLGSVGDKEVAILYRAARQAFFEKVKAEHKPKRREGETHRDKRSAFPAEVTASANTLRQDLIAGLRRRVWPEWTVLRGNEAGDVEEGAEQ